MLSESHHIHMLRKRHANTETHAIYSCQNVSTTYSDSCQQHNAHCAATRTYMTLMLNNHVTVTCGTTQCSIMNLYHSTSHALRSPLEEPRKQYIFHSRNSVHSVHNWGSNFLYCSELSVHRLVIMTWVRQCLHDSLILIVDVFSLRTNFF